MKKELRAAAAAFSLIFALSSCSSMGREDTDALENGKDKPSATITTVDKETVLEELDTGTTAPEPEEEVPPEDDYSYTVSFLCAGDNLIHDNIYWEAWENGGETHYDFTDAYAHVEKYFNGVDLAILNQETLVTDLYEPQSYPTFISPTAVGDKAIDLGFNAFSMSNNHVLDGGADGLISSLDYWDSKGVVHYGAYRDEADAEDIKTTEINGITFAFLGYMEHTNGFFLDEDGPGKVIYLDEEDVIKRQVEAADKIADVVVVSCHFGTEIMNELNQQQIDMAPKLVEWGADLIIGTQAHTLSTCEYIDKPDGGRAFCFYGLGNFISTMYDVKSLVGEIGKLTIIKDPSTGSVSFENVKAIPIVSHFEGYDYYSPWFNCAVYPYAEYTDDLIARNYVAELTRQGIEDVISYIPEEFLSIE
ncbi:MAG: CapA family protein [Ruminococcus sp.]|nr:CapA family protein [Ruminococcus sp.]